MEKLNPIVLGRLAVHIKEVVEKYPNDKEMTEEELNDPNFVEEWEKQLIRLVEADPLIPFTYDQIQNTPPIDFLIDYYSR